MVTKLAVIIFIGFVAAVVIEEERIPSDKDIYLGSAAFAFMIAGFLVAIVEMISG